MSKNTTLVVYNTCGLSKKNNWQWYEECIDNLFQQDLQNYVVAVSDCMGLDIVRNNLKSKYGNKINFFLNEINEIYTVNTTFNMTVRKAIKKYGEFESYLFIDSGFKFGSNKNLRILYEKLKEYDAAMISTNSDDDNGFQGLGNFDPNEIITEDYIVPLGKACNCHCQLFSHTLYEAFEGKLIPDIFAAHCTESVFTFLCAAVGKRWVLTPTKNNIHIKSIDGASMGFRENKVPWDYTIGSKTMSEIVSDPEAFNCGLGYEECNGILMHNPFAYDLNGKCKDMERLRKFIVNNLFVDKSIINYDRDI